MSEAHAPRRKFLLVDPGGSQEDAPLRIETTLATGIGRDPTPAVSRHDQPEDTFVVLDNPHPAESRWVGLELPTFLDFRKLYDLPEPERSKLAARIEAFTKLKGSGFVSFHGRTNTVTAPKGKVQPATESESSTDELKSLQQRLDAMTKERDAHFVRAESLSTLVRQLRSENGRYVRSADQHQTEAGRLRADLVGLTNRLIDGCARRDKVHDDLASAIIAHRAGKVLFTESYQGFVLEVRDESVIVGYEVEGDEILHEYNRSQFKDGVLPHVGQRVASHVQVTALGPDDPPVGRLTEVAKGEEDEPSKPLRGEFEL